MPNLQGQVTFEQVQSQPAYGDLNPAQQVEVADDFFVKHVASMQNFQSLEPAQQEEVKQDFRVKYNVPQIEMDDAREPRQADPAPSMPDFSKPLAYAGSALGAVAGDRARMLKGATLGYADFTEPIDAFTQQQRQIAGLPKEMPFENIRQGAYEFAGGAAPFIGTDGLLNAGGILKGTSILANMGREALAGGLLGGLSKPEGNDWLNIPQRLSNAAGWAAAGAAIPLAGRVLKGGVNAVKEIFTPNTRPISSISRQQLEKQLMDRIVQSREKQVMGQKLYKVRLQAMVSELEKLKTESAPIIQKRVEEKLAQIKSGKVTPGEAQRIQAFIKNAPRIAKAKKESVFVQEAKAKFKNQSEPVAQEAKTAQPEAKPTEQPKQKETVEKPPQKTLKGSVQEMVTQALEDFGGTLDEAKALIGKVKALGKADDDPAIQALKEKRKALGNKRDDATKEAKAKIDAEIQVIKDERKDLRDKASTINPNLQEVLNTGWDGKSPITLQGEVSETQLKRDAIEDLLNDAEKAKADKIDEAMQNGNTVSVEHAAEITGSTDAAIKITGTGKVKLATSKITPTHYGRNTKIVTKDGKVLQKGSKEAREALEAGIAEEKEFASVYGYNEQGYLHQYYLTKTPEGSEIAKVGKIFNAEAHLGTTPNVYLGQRKYKVADVLGRKPQGEGVITSEALEAANTFKDLLKPEIFDKLPTPIKSVLKDAQKKGNFTESHIKLLREYLSKNKKEAEEFCKVFGQ